MDWERGQLSIIKNYLKYKDKGFEVYQVSLDRSRSDWVNAIKKDNLIYEKDKIF